MASGFKLGLLIWILSALSISACVSKPTPEVPTSNPIAVPGPTISQPVSAVDVKSQPTSSSPQAAAQPTAAPADAQSLWKSSPHAQTFVTDAQGNNNECARCHAPMNWMPTAVEDIPSTCQACKFKMPTPKPVVQADWKNVGCEQCHKTEKGAVTRQVAWLNAAIAQFDTNADPYETVKSNAELCGKCHRDAFQVDVGKTVHARFPCTDCHNAHALSATCTNSQCHSSVLTPPQPIPGHDAAHAKVACTACHDAAKLEVGPTDDKSVWAAYKTFEIGGQKTRTPYVSHNLQRAVDCARCHSGGNTWGLKTY